MKKIIITITTFVLIFSAVFLINLAVLAWNPPSTSPPGENVDPPLSIGPEKQIKAGPLHIDNYIYTLSVVEDIKKAIKSYDINGNNIVDDRELLRAIDDWANDKLSKKILNIMIYLWIGDSKISESPTNLGLKDYNFFMSDDGQLYSAIFRGGKGLKVENANLTVDYNIKASSYCIGTNCITSWASLGLPSGTANQTLRHDGTNWIANSNIYHDGDKIGIGTTDPKVKLDVKGTIIADPGNSKTTTSIPLVAIGTTNDANHYAFAAYSGSVLKGLFYIRNDGYVGVGTSQPTQKLHVDGNIRITGTPTDDDHAATKGYVDSKEATPTSNNLYLMAGGWNAINWQGAPITVQELKTLLGQDKILTIWRWTGLRYESEGTIGTGDIVLIAVSEHIQKYIPAIHNPAFHLYSNRIIANEIRTSRTPTDDSHVATKGYVDANSASNRVYSAHSMTRHDMNGAGGWLDIPEMTLTFNVKEGETITCFFNAYAAVNHGGAALYLRVAEGPNTYGNFAVMQPAGGRMSTSFHIPIIAESTGRKTYRVQWQGVGSQWWRVSEEAYSGGGNTSRQFTCFVTS